MFQNNNLLLQLSPISHNPKHRPTEPLLFSLAATAIYLGTPRNNQLPKLYHKGTKRGTELGQSAVPWRRSQTCWQSCGGLVPTAQAMVLPMALVSCWLCWGSGWASIYLNYRFMSTAALYLCEKYDLSSLFVDSRVFSSGPFWHSQALPR